MPQPLFTTVSFLQTQMSYLVPGPCGPPIQPKPSIERVCDESGYYTLEVTQIFVVKTQITDDICHYFLTILVEQYHSLEFCDTYKPPDISPLEEWFGLLQPPPLTYEYPPAPFPRHWNEPAVNVPGTTTFACATEPPQVVYSIACVKGLLRVTRHMLITLVWPIPNGECLKLQWTTEEAFTTTEVCEESDWVDMPEGSTGGVNVEEKWKEAAGNTSPLREPSDDGVFRVGMEGDARTPYRRAVRDILRQEHAAGVVATQTRSRFVVLRAIDGAPCTPAAMDIAAEKPKSVLTVGLEGSEFYTKIPVKIGHAGKS